MARDPLEQPREAIAAVYAYVAYRIGPGPDAEDVVSEVIERALRYRASYDSKKGPPIAWLTGIASNCLTDRARSVAKQPEPVPDLEAVEPSDAYETVEMSRDLRDALARLDDRDRELIALRYGADMKAKDIAKSLDMKTNAVEVALHRALARLRQHLDDAAP